ncbi:hypothetical protein CHLNCDRAFT_34731 [Chlorella variabilis]|uniref:Cytochrome P450 n=1 Tax=Chlorella variabilis TaxID=554065 RepID=E1Z9C7_CHLVA|nr:hypothetical protein CHLNCDRAFT_34731 [Chlorella variabilis]EFN57493.1 hypothetical protein CHLNCDRAFT_34731 [Chlorella variabilis]|eukprot:XP_005849595.1 hypothetical protein CHLNCDRAFT_34731 [Chlorella variabilis]
MRATLDVIGRVAFDIDFRAVQEFNVAASNSQPTSNPEDDEIFTIIRESMNELNSRWANPLRGRYMFWLPEVRHAMRYWRALQQHMRGVLREIRSRGPPADGDESIAAHLMRLKDPHTGQPLADDRLLPEIATFFVAGTDTTAHTMTWTLYLVAQHPEVEARLCAELDALGLLATPQRPEPRMVEVEDLSRLVYLAAVVKESMRVLPVSADGTAIQAPRDIQLGPHTIPANTIIWVHIFSCHNSARYWDQPDRFLPERFMQPGAEYAASGPQGKTAGEAAAGQQAAAAAAGGQSAPPSQEKLPGDGSSAQGEAEVQHRPDSHGSSSLSPSFSSRAVGSGGGSSQPLRFFPFSQGPRNCVGQSLAKMDYLAILAVLLGRYTFQLTPEVTAPGGVRDIISLTLQPEHGLPVLAVPRVPQL